jgi:hypothetical protein
MHEVTELHSFLDYKSGHLQNRREILGGKETGRSRGELSAHLEPHGIVTQKIVVSTCAVIIN